MTSRNNVNNTHIEGQVRRLHDALVEIISTMNRPQRDDALIEQAGISLDRALFPLLVGIERVGPIGIVDLSERAGRDYTTVSRQVSKLEGLGLVIRQPGKDKRVSEAAITPRGKAMTDLVDGARTRLGKAVFASWPPGDVDELVRLLTKFAEAIRATPVTERPRE